MIKAENDKAERCGRNLDCAMRFVKRAGGTVIPLYCYQGCGLNYGFFLSPKKILWQWSAKSRKKDGKPVVRVRVGRSKMFLYGSVTKYHYIKNRAELEALMKREDESAAK